MAGDPGGETVPVESPLGWVYPVWYADGERVNAPGLAWRRRSERIERTSLVWTVRTRASCYRLDLREGTVVRTELQGGDRAAVDQGLVAHGRLRGDAVPVQLWAVLDCRRGEPMVLLLDLAGDGRRGTCRVTTAVVAIDPEAGHGERPA